ncbi:MAG: hypothetical protein K1X89_01225 [Myxococcaceae bacterium]|nr:hypothetical protein [Myxococcaceae bacterium]
MNQRTAGWWVVALSLALACGPKTLKQRMAQSESIANEVDEILSKAETKMRELEPKDADELLEDARQELGKPNAELYPEWQMLADRLKRDQAAIPAVQEARRKRDLEEKAKRREDDLKGDVADCQQAFEALAGPKATSDDLERYQKRAKSLQSGLDEQPELEKEVPAWAEKVKGYRAMLAGQAGKLPAIAVRVEFAEGPVAREAQAREALDEVKATKDPAKKASKQEDVVKGYQGCVSEGKVVLGRHPGATLNPIQVGGRSVIPSAFVNDCERALTAAKATLKKLAKAATPPKKGKK